MKRNGEQQPMSEINITPLTDVMLVLLIIFMISSPVLLARGMEVHLPQVAQPPMLAQQDHVLYITTDGKIDLDGKLLTRDDLPVAFKDLVSAADEKREVVNLFIHADADVTYGAMTGIMDMATTAGIQQISLVQDVIGQPSSNPAPPLEESPAPTSQPPTEEAPAEPPGTN